MCIQLERACVLLTCNVSVYHSQGGKTGAVQKCTACRGRGMRIMIRQLAPGMVQQMQSVCTDCNGEGKPVQSKQDTNYCVSIIFVSVGLHLFPVN